jgi:hypothetical protein
MKLSAGRIAREGSSLSPLGYSGQINIFSYLGASILTSATTIVNGTAGRRIPILATSSKRKTQGGNGGIRLRNWIVSAAPPGGRRILFLGGSITLGWGVPEDLTEEARLEHMVRARGQQIQVLNGGVGNLYLEKQSQNSSLKLDYKNVFEPD